MKIILTVFLMSITTQVFATCAEDFTNGYNEYDFASRYFKKGVDSYNEAVAQSGSQNPSFNKVCGLLVDSVSGFTVSTDTYQNCVNLFQRASQTCGAGDSQQAAKNMEICLSNQRIAVDNQTTLRSVLKNTCFKGAKISVELEDGILNESRF